MKTTKDARRLFTFAAVAALIDLNLSENAQFHDKAGACKLIETAAKRGDQAAAQGLSECRAN